LQIEGAKIFITGGAGFIGSHIAEELLKQGASITVYDNFSFGTEDNLSHIWKDIKVIKGDILDYEHLQREMKGHDIVSHHAAQLEIFLGVEDPHRDLEINTIGTLNVFKAAHQNQIAKVVNASSACIYGQTEKSTSEDYLPVPNWAYGVSKLAAERYGTIYTLEYKLPVINLRYGITYGEREWFRRVLTIFIKQVLIDKPIVIFGNGQQIRDFIYVKDAVLLHNLCIKYDSITGGSYNVATGIPTSIVDLAHLVQEVANDVLGKRAEIVYEEINEGAFSKLVPDKKRNIAELKMMLLDIKKAYDDFKWKPIVKLREGIEKEMLWAKENLHRWKKVYYSYV